MEVGSFDVVLAANVLHATVDLAATLRWVRCLLRPGGKLLLSEATRAQDFGTMVFGLTLGWWLAQDRQRRIPFSPLASVEGWRTLLADSGFDDVQALTAGGSAAASPHAVLAATNREAFAAIEAARPQPVAVQVATRAAAGRSLTRLQQHLWTVLAMLKLEPDDASQRELRSLRAESLTALEIRNRLDQTFPVCRRRCCSSTTRWHAWLASWLRRMPTAWQGCSLTRCLPTHHRRPLRTLAASCAGSGRAPRIGIG